MEVYVERTKETKNVTFSGSVKELLDLLNINPETVIVIKNNKIITLNSKIKNSDKIKILSVISGG